MAAGDADIWRKLGEMQQDIGSLKSSEETSQRQRADLYDKMGETMTAVTRLTITLDHLSGKIDPLIRAVGELESMKQQAIGAGKALRATAGIWGLGGGAAGAGGVLGTLKLLGFKILGG